METAGIALRTSQSRSFANRIGLDRRSEGRPFRQSRSVHCTPLESDSRTPRPLSQDRPRWSQRTALDCAAAPPQSWFCFHVHRLRRMLLRPNGTARKHQTCTACRNLDPARSRSLCHAGTLIESMPLRCIGCSIFQTRPASFQLGHQGRFLPSSNLGLQVRQCTCLQSRHNCTRLPTHSA